LKIRPAGNRAAPFPLDQDETVREAREMQESLRRYVPGAVAEQLGSGADLTSGEREVSVLFVDIRGYTSFSESRRAEEIFSTVNRYTETVSEIVRKHGGSVVEFNGDGMMTVFGAPRELAHKERAAVEAGREIAAAVGAMPVDDAQGGQTKLSVGVGIATGEAFVGNIQAVDRMIWSAIGNTTNLAARLQGLTRELDASLVIDRATWERAQAAAADFEKRSEVPIRGRRETRDVYTLPMQSDS
jgi:adenylate cyclase